MPSSQASYTLHVSVIVRVKVGLGRLMNLTWLSSLKGIPSIVYALIQYASIEACSMRGPGHPARTQLWTKKKKKGTKHFLPSWSLHVRGGTDGKVNGKISKLNM